MILSFVEGLVCYYLLKHNLLQCIRLSLKVKHRIDMAPSIEIQKLYDLRLFIAKAINFLFFYLLISIANGVMK